MTCIVWDGKTLAADKRALYGGMIATVTKIKRIGDVLCGGAGDFTFVNAMFAWVENGRDPTKFPDSQRTKEDWHPFLVIEKDGTPCFYERTPYPIIYEDAYVVLGSGREFARAALFLGHSAEVAVEVACKLDSGCGNGIDILKL